MYSIMPQKLDVTSPLVLHFVWLTLKVQRKILEQTTIYLYFLFFKENNA